MNKKPFWTRVGDFLMGKGFYMVLLLCVMAIGGSGYYLFHLANSTLSSVEQPVSGTAQVQVDRQPAADSDQAVGIADALREADEAGAAFSESPQEKEPAQVSDTESEAKETIKTEEPAEESQAAQPEQAKETVAEVPVQQAAAFTAPVEGETVAAFSNTELTYNAALGDWRTHNGLDLSAAVGDEVHAAMDGEVLAISDDVLLGTTVTVNHGDGLMTVYGNLDSQLCVAQGDRISAGQVIGTVGQTANGESHEGAWLHFAVQKDGELVDPMEYLPVS